MVYPFEGLKVVRSRFLSCKLCLIAFLFTSMFFSASLLTSQASALELGNTGLTAFDPSYSGFSQSSQYLPLSCNSVGNSINCPLASQAVLGYLRLKPYNTIPKGSIVSFSFYLQGEGINGSFHGFSGGENNSIISQDYTALDGSTISGFISIYAGADLNMITLGGYTQGVIGWIGTTQELASFSMATWITTSASTDYTTVLSSIATNTSGLATVIAYQAQTTRDLIYTELRQNSTDINNVIAYQEGVTRSEIQSTIQTQATRIIDAMGGVSDSIDDQTQKIQDIHDDEVDRIETGVGDGQDTIDGLDTSINPVNPISWFFSGLEVHSCYDITQLATLVHAPSNVYCSWFSSGLRDIVSPVINLLSTIIVIGFMYSWLKKGGI